MYLTPSDMQAIEARVAALEKDLGLQVVTMVVAKSDVYPETVWKAFALGSAMTALVVAAGEILRSEWSTPGAVLASVVALLAVGAACALAAVHVPGIARLFLRESRAALEVSHCAKAQFLDRQLFATKQRTAVLVLVSMLERRVVILADTGLNAHVSAAEWDAVIARMTAKLRNGATGEAILDGLDALRGLLAGKKFAHETGNAFADRPIEEPGA
ncbi:MAG TPA: TPM domain-containing protein [Casimicrobiaceae bacterium]|nr:TPM domain-containing protein [Casimicrobiaceae bacterium]